jgi:ParB-like chromosome segregation protein Spo0J
MMARRLARRVERERSLVENLHRWPAAWSRIAESARGRLVAV